MPESAREGALTPEQQLSNWRTLLRQLVSLGVTSVNVAGVRPDGLKLVQTLYDRWGNELPRMTVQLRVSPGYDSHENAEEGAKVSIREIEAIGDPSKVFNHPKLKMGAVKMSIDGGLSAPVFWSTLPYEGRPPFYGVQRIPAYSFTSVARRAHELGWQLGIHTMGDGAVVMVVDELERILKDRPRANHRHYLHHVAVLPPDDTVKKMANLDINVASQPGFLLALGAFADEALDPLREETQQPAASLVARGVRVSFGSDAGPYGPLAGIYAAVTRRHWDRTIRGPREAVSARDAIAMHTLESAYFNFNEKTVGSIEVGKAADFVVLDRDPTAIDPEQIQHVKVERTIIGGQEIFVSSSATAQR
jgi:predicted amidohydrolase YtcJ